jgi:hypothetical protein
VSSIASQVLERKSVSKLEADLNQSKVESSSTDEKVLQDVLATMYAGNGTFPRP